MDENFPTLRELKQRIKADIDSSLNLSGRALPVSFAQALSIAMAGAVYLLYRFLKLSVDDFFISTAREKSLVKRGESYGIFRKVAILSQGMIEARGNNGVVIPENTRLERNGVFYRTIQEGVISELRASLEVISEAPGHIGNVLEGETLYFSEALAGVFREATILEGGISGGGDEESVEDYRSRVLDRLRTPPQGGSKNDYIRWAKSIAGVTRAWVYENHGDISNGVGVAFVLDGNQDIIANQAKVNEVQRYLVSPERKPVTARVIAFSPRKNLLNLTIRLNPNTPAVQRAVELNLRELISREAEPAGAIDANSVIRISKIREAISTAVGEQDHEVVTPRGDVTPNPYEIVVLGEITWQNL